VLVLGLELLGALELGGLNAAVLGLPVIEGGAGDSVRSAGLLVRAPGVGLLEDRHDLGLTESGLFHGCDLRLAIVPECLIPDDSPMGEAYGERLVS